MIRSITVYTSIAVENIGIAAPAKYDLQLMKFVPME
jgi:hypothetical protein